jgi:hypothetical protein
MSGYQEQASSRAITAFVLGIAAFFLGCLPLAIAAWIVGRKEVNAIDRGMAPAAGRTFARVGFIMGMVLTILQTLALLVVLAIYGTMIIVFIMAAIAGA